MNKRGNAATLQARQPGNREWHQPATAIAAANDARRPFTGATYARVAAAVAIRADQ